MCGAVSIQYDPALREELSKFLSEDEIKRFERNGEIVFAYWDKRPLLPVRQGNTRRYTTAQFANVHWTLFACLLGATEMIMITEAATPEFKALTGHDWMPRLKEEKES